MGRMIRHRHAAPSHASHFLVAMVLLLTALLTHLCHCERFNGFALEVPVEKRYAAFYDQYYTNLAGVDFVSSAARMHAVNEVTEVYGGGAARSRVNASELVLLNLGGEGAALWTDMCTWDKAHGAQTWRRALQDANVRFATSTIAPVLVTTDDRHGARTTATHVALDLHCLFDTIMAYNEEEQATGSAHLIGAVLLATSDLTRKTSLRVEDALGERQLPQLTFTPLLFDDLGSRVTDDTAGQEWRDVVRAAWYNERRAREGHRFPFYVVEYRAKADLLAWLAQTNTTIDDSAHGDDSRCLCEMPRASDDEVLVACAPVGGWTVWGGTGPIAVRWNATRKHFDKLTRRGTVALLVPATTDTPTAGRAPGADSPGSALVAALAIADVMRRRVPERDLYVFFVPAEMRGGVGSGRLVHDTQYVFSCPGDGTLQACQALAYGDALEFTSVDLGRVDVVVGLDQLAYSDAPLFFHVDARLDEAAGRRGGTALQRAKAILRAHNATQAATRYLPSSPVSSILDLLLFAPHDTPASSSVDTGASMDDGTTDKRDVVVLTVSRYNTTYSNPHVFTTDDTADGEGNASALSLQAIAAAANAVLHVLTDRDELYVNETLMQELWYCVTTRFDCPFLAATPSAPQRGDASGGGNKAQSAPVRPDFATRAWSDGARRPHEWLLMQALEVIGLRPYLAPAIPPALAIETNYGPCWHRSATWSGGAAPTATTRYDLHVMSIVQDGRIGARIATLGSWQVSAWTLLLGVLVTLAVSLLGWRVSATSGTPMTTQDEVVATGEEAEGSRTKTATVH